MKIRAIETRYRGHRFRSRLEARWAVFFDALGVRWEYEPQGFEVHDICGDGRPGRAWHYLPDFYLTDSGTWVEVKGDLADVTDDYLRMIACAVDWGGALPGVGDSVGSTRGLLWLGPVPYLPGYADGPPLHPVLQHSKGGWLAEAWFGDAGLRVEPGLGSAYFDSTWGDQDGLRRSLDALVYAPGETITLFTETGLSPAVADAYLAARAARFEHGESP